MDIDTPAPKTGGDKMDVDEGKENKEEAKEKEEGDDKDGAAATSEAKKKPEKEKVGYEIENMSRVLPGQLKYISFPSGRYKPVKKVRLTSPGLT